MLPLIYFKSNKFHKGLPMSSFVEKLGWHFNYGNNHDDEKELRGEEKEQRGLF